MLLVGGLATDHVGRHDHGHGLLARGGDIRTGSLRRVGSRGAWRTWAAWSERLGRWVKDELLGVGVQFAGLQSVGHLGDVGRWGLRRFRSWGGQLEVLTKFSKLLNKEIIHISITSKMVNPFVTRSVHVCFVYMDPKSVYFRYEFLLCYMTMIVCISLIHVCWLREVYTYFIKINKLYKLESTRKSYA